MNRPVVGAKQRRARVDRLIQPRRRPPLPGVQPRHYLRATSDALDLIEHPALDELAIAQREGWIALRETGSLSLLATPDALRSVEPQRA